MATVVGVVFQPGGKVYSFDPGGLELRWDERVICQTARGPRVRPRRRDRARGARRVAGRAAQAGRPPRRPGRRAGDRAEPGRGQARHAALPRALAPPRPRAEARLLARSRSTGRASPSRSRRRSGPTPAALQTELGERLKRRVDIRQVGPREQGRLCGAVGLCGTNQLCSARYPCHDQPITLRMAKDQQLPMNPGRITGLCGRLRCCLAFEHPLYRSFRDRAPAVGRTVATPEGKGIVRSYEVLRDACVVEMDGRTMMEVKLDAVVEVAG